MERESSIERYLCRLAEQHGGHALKHGQDGWPDRIVILPEGNLIWVELKRPDGKLSELQKFRIHKLKSLGQRVEVVWNKDDVANLFS